MRGQGGEPIGLTRPLPTSGAGRAQRALGGKGPTPPAGLPAGGGERAERRTPRREGDRTARAGTVGGNPLRPLQDRAVTDVRAFGWEQTRQGLVGAAEAQRLREKEPLTGMAQAPGSNTAPTTGLESRWRQRSDEAERGDEERGKPWCSIHRFDTTKPTAGAGNRRRVLASGCGERSSIWKHHAGNGGQERRRPTGDRGRRDDETNRRDVEHVGRHAHEKLEPARWFARRLESARSMTRRTERRSQRRQIPAFSGPGMREVVRPAQSRDRPWVFRRRSEKPQE